MIVVTAQTLPGKFDPSAEAHFVNGSRAGKYAQALADSGDYHTVKLQDSAGTSWVIAPAVSK